MQCYRADCKRIFTEKDMAEGKVRGVLLEKRIFYVCSTCQERIIKEELMRSEHINDLKAGFTPDELAVRGA